MILKVLRYVTVLIVLFVGCKDDSIVKDDIKYASLTFTQSIHTLGQQPAFSPDGRKIAFMYKGDIFVMDTSAYTSIGWKDNDYTYDTVGGSVHRLSSGSSFDFLPRWSPDGSKVGFLRCNNIETDIDADIWIVDVDGANSNKLPTEYRTSYSQYKKTLTYGGFGVPMWDFSPDGQLIAYFSAETDSVYLNVCRVTDAESIYRESVFQNNGEAHPSLVWSDAKTICFIKSITSSNMNRVVQLNLFTNEYKADTILFNITGLTRSLNIDKYYYFGGTSGFLIISNLKGEINSINLYQSKSAKISFDDNFIVFERLTTIVGPDGYSFSKIVVHDQRTNKEMDISVSGQPFFRNWYYDWNRNANILALENYQHIVIVYVQR